MEATAVSRMSRAYVEAQEFLLDGRPLDDDLIAVLRALTDEEVGTLREATDRGLVAQQEEIESRVARRNRVKANRECLRMEIAHRFPEQACGETPIVTISSDSAMVSEEMQQFFTEMAASIKCSEPQGHEGDHVARDRKGVRLAEWPQW
jgi:hypothetical protein